jgi:hypothetical protein
MIKITKLISGEEIIGDVTPLPDDRMRIDKPVALAYVPSRDQPGQQAMGMVPYGPYTKEHSIEISANHVIWQGEIIDEIYNQYNEIFGSGIQIVGGKL